jgi:putative colanic acid biosynthesis acetyltransferase WcaF
MSPPPRDGNCESSGKPTDGVDLSSLSSELSLANRLARAVWGGVYAVLFRPSPRIAHRWRRWLLRRFGARIGRGVRVYPTARIWGPWNLEVGDFSTIGPDVDCYCVAPIRIGANAVVSQYSYLCSATHDPSRAEFPLVTREIAIADQAWVAADVFIGPGVTVGQGAVCGARASVYKDVEPWTIVGGNPAKPIKKRTITRP